MANFNIWEYLITKTGSIVTVEFYYMLIKVDSEITVRIREEFRGYEKPLGTYPNLEEAVKAVEEFKEKVSKLAKFEEDLNLF